MRVALLTNFIPPYRVPFLQELARQVGSLRVFVSTRMETNRMWSPDWSDLDVSVQRTLTFRKVWKTSRFAYPYDLHVPYDTILQLNRYRPDVIVTGEMGARTLQAVLYGRARRVPVVVWATLADHLEDSKGRARAAFRRRLLKHVAAVIVNGRSGATYVQRMGVPAERVTIVPQTTNLEPFQSLELTRAGLHNRTLLVVGNLTPLKGVDLLLRACALLDAPPRMLIVGEGPQRSQLEEIARSGGIDVEWTGHVPYEALPQFYQRAGILVFPTLGDEWGLVVNEALAAGLPVLGSLYSQAVQDLIRDGENGWHFRPDSELEVANALQRALNSTDEQLAAMRRSARASVQNLQTADVAVRFANVLREVTSENDE